MLAPTHPNDSTEREIGSLGADPGRAVGIGAETVPPSYLTHGGGNFVAPYGNYTAIRYSKGPITFRAVVVAVSDVGIATHMFEKTSGAAGEISSEAFESRELSRHANEVVALTYGGTQNGSA